MTGEQLTKTIDAYCETHHIFGVLRVTHNDGHMGF